MAKNNQAKLNGNFWLIFSIAAQVGWFSGSSVMVAGPF